MSTIDNLSAGLLAVDVSDVAAGAKQFVDNRAAVGAYVTAIRAVPLGSQPIMSGGKVAAQFDPLEKLPEVAKALRAAKHHADDVASNLDFLHGWAQGTIRNAVDMILNPVRTMHGILQQVPSGGVLTDEQSAEVYKQMYMARFMSGMLGSTARSTRNGIHDFLAALSADHAVLTEGPIAIARAEVEAEAYYRQLGLQLLPNPVTAGIGKAIMEIGAQFLAQLRALRSALTNALQGHEAMSAGIDAFNNGIQAVTDKYATGEQLLNKASAAERTAALRRFDLGRAITSLEQLRDFVLQSGF